jgi:hypothetical protein
MCGMVQKRNHVIAFSAKETIGMGIINPRFIKPTTVVRATLGESGWTLEAVIHGLKANVYLEADTIRIHVIDVCSTDVVVPDSVTILESIVRDLVINACDPVHGRMSPSQRNLVKNHVPPQEWEGWSLFLNEISRTIEVFGVMSE